MDIGNVMNYRVYTGIRELHDTLHGELDSEVSGPVKAKVFMGTKFEISIEAWGEVKDTVVSVITSELWT